LPVATGWFPADFLASVGSTTNDFIVDGSPVVILIIGLILAVWLIDWLVALFNKKEK
jgi:hypothetical protein